MKDVISQVTITAAALAFSWVVGEVLGTIFPTPDSGTKIMAGFGILIIAGIAVCGFLGARERFPRS